MRSITLSMGEGAAVSGSPEAAASFHQQGSSKQGAESLTPSKRHADNDGLSSPDSTPPARSAGSQRRSAAASGARPAASAGDSQSGLVYNNPFYYTNRTPVAAGSR